MNSAHPCLAWTTDKAQLTTRNSLGAFAEPGFSSVATISCIITGSKKRFVDANGETMMADWSVTVSGSIAVEPGDKIVSGINMLGQTVLDSGRIVQVNNGIHPTLGFVLKELLVTRGGAV